MIGHILEFEVTGIVEKAYVDAAGIGRIMMYDLEIPFLKIGLVDNVFHYGAILNLRHADNSRADRSCLGGELRYCIGEVAYFIPIFAAIPFAGTVRGEFVVTTLGIVGNSIEKVFPVIERYACHLHPATGVLSRQRGGCHSRHNE